ncbi:glycosyltransferase [Thermoanaerobacterium sp. DL9XJH110]|uniref:glycosyltransferase n=1 Tax=Thermoanaerobacterium sp. DL9XJH110 TaxID=3386643 RepID=UPI003BB68711
MGLKDEDICILTVAELIPNKNRIQLIEAMKKITGNHNIFCFFAGDRSLEEELKKHVKDNKLDYKISFLGFRTASLMSLREGLPRCIMEYEFVNRLK